VQVLDVLVNKIIKQYIEESEDLWVDEHFDEWQSGKYSVGDRRVLMTKWVGEAWEKLHRDHELSIRDLPNIAVGDYTRIPEASEENPIVVPDNISDTIEVDNADEGYLYTEQDVEEGIAVKVEDDITADSGDESDQQFDYDSESSFGDSVDGDEDKQDEDIE